MIDGKGVEWVCEPWALIREWIAAGRESVCLITLLFHNYWGIP